MRVAAAAGMPGRGEELLSAQALHLRHRGNRRWSSPGMIEVRLSP